MVNSTPAGNLYNKVRLFGLPQYFYTIYDVLIFLHNINLDFIL